MNYAINYYYNKQVDTFFGPVCDYVVAPILRQATFWNLPMITVGANAWGFVKYRRTMFPMLTRVGPVNHYSLVNFFMSQISIYAWRKVKVVSIGVCIVLVGLSGSQTVLKLVLLAIRYMQV